MHTKPKTNTDGRYIKQEINNNRTTALERTAAKGTGGGGGGLNAFYWRQIFALDSVVVNTQNLYSSHGGFLTNAKTLSQRNNLSTFTYNVERAHVSQIVKAKENLKLSYGGPNQGKHQTPTN